MSKFYKNATPRPFLIPETIKFINVDLVSGQPSNNDFITESFKRVLILKRTFKIYKTVKKNMI